METVEFRPDPDQYAWTFGGVRPIRRITPGTMLHLWTDDAFSGKLWRPSDKLSQVIRDGRVNPQTGPFHVDGAEPGDTLVLHFVAITPSRDWGVSALTPWFGALTATESTAMLHDALPEMTWIYQLDREKDVLRFEAQRSGVSLDLPTRPMLGTVGVAPAHGEVRSSLAPGRFGGNMDVPDVMAGSTVFLGVNVEGGLFSMGDGHYRQGEGESCGSAVEGAMDVTVMVELVKGGAPTWPRLENDDHFAVVGSSRPLEDAWRISQVGMVGWLGELYGLDPMDAYQLLTQISQSSLANVVNTSYSAVTKVSKKLLPPAAAYGDMHRYLREQAANI